jgi:hypothetical protein
MSIKIAGIQLVPINLHDTRCAQRGEVSQREGRHRVTLWALSMPILYEIFGLKHLSFHDEMTVSREGVCSPLGPSAARVFGGMHASILRAIALVNAASTRVCCTRVLISPSFMA